MELFRLLGIVAIDTEQAERALNDVSRQANNTGDETSTAFGKIGAAAGKIGKAILTSGVALGGAFIGAVEGTREYRQEMGLLESAFQTAGHSTEEAKNTYSELNAVLGDSGQAVEASQHLALIADNEAELSELTHTLTGVYATFGESLPLEGLAEGINHSAKLGEVQGSLADALEWSGVTVDDFNAQLAACSSEEERQKLITDTLKETYSKAADQYKETNNDIIESRKAQERLSDAMAEVGRVGEPIMTAFRNIAATIAEHLAPALEIAIQKIKDIATWIKDNEQKIQMWIGVILGASTAIGAFLLVLNWGSIMAAATKAIKGVRAAVLLFNTALKANPIGLVVSLIAGLVAAFIYLWNTNEDFRKFWIDLWNKIKSAGGTAIDWIKGKFNDFKGALKTVKNVFGEIKNTISEKINSARDAVDKAIKKIKGFFNIKLKFKGISMPDISIKWGKSPKWMYEAAQLLGLEGVPKFSVKWNAEGGILDKPTIFGRLANGTLLGGGESGAEAIAPITLLKDYIQSAVSTAMTARDGDINNAISEQTRLLMSFLSEAMPKSVFLDSSVLVGQLIPAIDVRLSDRWINSMRGNTR